MNRPTLCEASPRIRGPLMAALFLVAFPGRPVAARTLPPWIPGRVQFRRDPPIQRFHVSRPASAGALCVGSPDSVNCRKPDSRTDPPIPGRSGANPPPKRPLTSSSCDSARPIGRETALRSAVRPVQRDSGGAGRRQHCPGAGVAAPLPGPAQAAAGPGPGPPATPSDPINWAPRPSARFQKLPSTSRAGSLPPCLYPRTQTRGSDRRSENNC